MREYLVFEQKKSGHWVWRRTVTAASRRQVMAMIEANPGEWLKLAKGNLKVRLKDTVTDSYGQSAPIMRTVTHIKNPLNLEVTA